MLFIMLIAFSDPFLSVSFKRERSFDMAAVTEPTTVLSHADLLFVLDLPKAVVHRFDQVSGAYLGAFGGEGMEPDQFLFGKEPQLTRCNDQIIVVDLFKLVYFTLDGKFLHCTKLPSILCDTVVALDDGRILMVADLDNGMMPWERRELLIWSPQSGRVEETLAVLNKGMFLDYDLPRIYRLYSERILCLLGPDRRHITFTTNYSQTIETIAVDGAWERTIPIPFPPREISMEEKQKRLKQIKAQSNWHARQRYSFSENPSFQTWLPLGERLLIGHYEPETGYYDMALVDEYGRLVGRLRQQFGAGRRLLTSGDDWFLVSGEADAKPFVYKLKATLVPAE